MDLFEVMRSRHSARSFLAKEVPGADVDKVLAAANQAPSAGNLQAYQVYRVRSAELKQGLALASFNQRFLADAPVVLVFCMAAARSARYGKRGAEFFCVQDAAVAAAYAQLAATDLGLATCWIGAFEDQEIIRLLDLPSDQRPIVLLPLGYSDSEPEGKERRPLSDLVIDKD